MYDPGSPSSYSVDLTGDHPILLYDEDNDPMDVVDSPDDTDGTSMDIVTPSSFPGTKFLAKAKLGDVTAEMRTYMESDFRLMYHKLTRLHPTSFHNITICKVKDFRSTLWCKLDELAKLMFGGWLNGVILTCAINAKIHSGNHSAMIIGNMPDYMYHNSLSSEIENIVKMTSGFRYVFIPLNENKHWTLLSVDLLDLKAQYFNSMQLELDPFHPHTYLPRAQPLLDALLPDIAPVTPETQVVRVLQTNKSDCGVWVVAAAWAMMEGWDAQIAYTQDGIPALRQAIYDLLTSSAHYDTTPSGDWATEVESE